MLYNQKYVNASKQLFLNDQKSIKNLKRELPLVMFIHGFTDSAIGPSTLSAMKVKDGKELRLRMFWINP